MIYCDTSLLVALVAEENHSAVADLWMRKQPLESLCASAWVGTEMASALALKRRSDALDLATRAQAARAAERLLASLRSVAIDTRHFVHAQRLVSTPPAGLRSGDALHLAIVIDHDLDLATLDRGLATAARHVGVVTPQLLPA